MIQLPQYDLAAATVAGLDVAFVPAPDVFDGEAQQFSACSPSSLAYLHRQTRFGLGTSSRIALKASEGGAA